MNAFNCSERELIIKDIIRVSGATRERCDSLEDYAEILQKWQKKINLVGQSTLNNIWRRHFLDSAQLVQFIPGKTLDIIDLGSGAGFPGLVLAILADCTVRLIESDTRKAEFLRQVIRLTNASASVHCGRIEAYSGSGADVIVSRACAPLKNLLEYASVVSHNSSKLLFLKGRSWEMELRACRMMWHIDYNYYASCTDPESAIIEINEFNRI